MINAEREKRRAEKIAAGLVLTTQIVMTSREDVMEQDIADLKAKVIEQHLAQNPGDKNKALDVQVQSMSCIQEQPQKECVQMPGKMARSDSTKRSGYPRCW
jgi:hypothetical protein